MDAGRLSPRLIEEDLKLRNDVAAAEIILALNDAGIESILLKGPSIAQWLYDKGESRPYGDVDLLVAPRGFAGAEGVAKRLGFRHFKVGDQLDEASGHRTWFREADGVCLELHHGFVGIPATHQEFWNEMTQDTETLPIGVRDVRAQIPSVPARALLVAVHAASHGPVGTPLGDLRRALERLPHNVWVEAVAFAERLRAEPAFAVGLSLVPEGVELVRRLGLDPAVPTNILVNASAPLSTTKGWEWFAAAPGVRGKLRFAYTKVAPPRDLMRAIDPIGRRGGIWLLIAYLVRPIRLAKQAPRGYRAWRELRRAGFRSEGK